MNGKLRTLILFGVYIVVLLFATIHFTMQLLDKAAKESFKKLYSAYSQALLITVDNMNGDTGCFYGSKRNLPTKISGCDRFYKNFAANLRVTKYCKNNALAKGCVPEYKSYAVTPPCAGFSENMINRYNQVFVMNDKTNLIIFNLPQNVQNPMFAVDSNGKLPPNRSGYDLFSFIIMRNERGEYYFHPNITYCLPVEKGGMNNLQDIYK